MTENHQILSAAAVRRVAEQEQRVTRQETLIGHLRLQVDLAEYALGRMNDQLTLCRDVLDLVE